MSVDGMLAFVPPFSGISTYTYTYTHTETDTDTDTDTVKVAFSGEQMGGEKWGERQSSHSLISKELLRLHLVQV